MHIEKKVLEQIKEFLVQRLSPSLIILFGSAIKGNFREDSDFDIAFFSDMEIDAYRIFLLAQELADLVSRDVDLVNLKETSIVFRAQIVGTGEVIYSKNQILETEYKIRTLKEYALLNEEREVIIKNIRNEGKVYE